MATPAPTRPPPAASDTAAIVAVIAVVAAALLGAGTTLAAFTLDRELSVGTIRLSVAPFHAGSFDIYVPVVDWGVRFDAVRMPARLEVGERALDRRALERVARGETLEVTDRGRPIARLVPVTADPWADMIAAGRVTPAEDDRGIQCEPPGDYDVDASAVLAAMREDER